MSASLRLMKWLLKTMKIKESYDRPIAEIEETKEKRNRKMSFSLKPLSGQRVEETRIGGREVLMASAEALTAAFEKAGSGCRLHVGQGMFHCYPAIRLIPECRAAFDEIVGYLKR